jgi:Carboxypeptidase regulatory-like domain
VRLLAAAVKLTPIAGMNGRAGSNSLRARNPRASRRALGHDREMKALLSCWFVIAYVLWRPTPVDACSCRAPGPPCASLFLSTVFVGKAIATVDKNGLAATTFEVAETLHALQPLGSVVKVRHSSSEGMCGMTFTPNATYVVYADGDLGALSTGLCSRTHELTANDEDVAFAHQRAASGAPGSAAVVEGLVEMSDDGKVPSGIKVRATQPAGTSGATAPITATADRKGTFKLTLAPGTYELDVATPGLRLWGGKRVEVALPVAAACARPELRVQWDGQIAGKVRDAAGQPVANLLVSAVSIDPASQRWRTFATTASGSYVIHEVTAGSYRVGISVADDGGPSPSSPYPTTYAPGTSSPKAAKRLKMKRAGVISNVDLVVPAALPVYTIRGAVRSSAGSPLGATMVSVGPVSGERSTGASSDAAGQYEVKELGGVPIVIRACVRNASAPPVCAEQTRTLSADTTVDLTLAK